jgi:tetratricopeptide (TPR) repeat protein
MAVKTEKDLDDATRSHWLKAVAAMELRNFGYAISLLQGILKREPQFLVGRQLLRRAEITRLRSEKKSFFNISTASIAVMKAQHELKKNPARSVEVIEGVLEREPFHRQANLLLKEAAVAAGWPEVGVMALETLLEEKPRDTKVLHELGRLYHELGESDRAVEIYNRITDIEPTDAEALRLGKDAAARASMETGGWTQAESYRDLIKDKEAAVSLEQQNRMQLTGESLDRQIAEVYGRHQAEPQNVELARRLGVLHEQKDDMESAIAWFEYAAQIADGADAGGERKLAELRMRVSARGIAQMEERLSGLSHDDPQYAERVAELQQAKRQRAALLVDEMRGRSNRNPTDLQLRFELGQHLLDAGRFREALPELQRARQNPSARLKTMNLLGRCYRELGMLDLAAKQLEEAAKEIAAMDATKKEIVYELGLVYAQMGDAQKSIACMKQIYESDYGYRDVATRVEESYVQERSSNQTSP